MRAQVTIANSTLTGKVCALTKGAQLLSKKITKLDVSYSVPQIVVNSFQLTDTGAVRYPI